MGEDQKSASKMIVKWFVLLILAVFTSETNENDEKNVPQKYGNIAENSILVKIEEDEHAEVNKKSEYIGVSFHRNTSKWMAQRCSKNKKFFNGRYDDEETAAHASDTVARKLMKNGEQNHKLNFPEDDTEVYPEKKKTSSKFIGVSFNKRAESMWSVGRWSKKENKTLFNGHYENEETAAHASDTLARKLMKNGEQNLKLSFPEDDTEVYPLGNQKKKRKRPKE